MTTQDVLALAKAGFTADQIVGLNGAMGVQQTAPQLPQPIVPTVNTALQQAENARLLEAMRQNNLIMAQQPPVQTTDDILASIIAPPSNTGGVTK